MEYQEYQLRETAARLLREEKVNVVIGYGTSAAGKVIPVFITKPEDAEKLVWNSECHQPESCHRTDVRAFSSTAGRLATAVGRFCDVRSVYVDG